MKFWIIPWPYDYHKQGEILVRATTKEAALKKAKEYVASEGNYRSTPNWNAIFEFDEDVYVNEGCDC